MNLQMMMSDMPWYDYDKTDDDVVEVAPEDEIKMLKKFAKHG